MSIRCDKCSIVHNSVESYESKLLINQCKYYNICDACYISESRFEEEYIQMLVSRNEALNSIVKASYYKDYCKFPIEVIKETIERDDKKYLLVNETEFYYLLSCLSNKVVETIERIKVQHKRELQRMHKNELREVRREANAQAKERKEHQKVELYEEKINKEIELNRIRNDILKNKKEEAIELYIEQAKMDNIELEVVKCAKCDKFKCKPYDFTNNYDYKIYKRSHIQGGQGQTCHYKICNDCHNNKVLEREENTIHCPCGLTYYAKNCYYKERHLLSKCHRLYEEKLMNKVNFDLMKLNELLEINKKHNLNIANYQKIGKKKLALEIKQLYNEGRFTL